MATSKTAMVAIVACAVIAVACAHPGASDRPAPTASITSTRSAGPGGSGGQRLAISASPRLRPSPSTNDYVDAFALTRSVGATAGVEAANWKDLETPSGLDRLAQSLSYQGDTLGFDLMLTIRTIDTTNLQLPTDLAPLAFDDPRVMRRMHTLIDSLVPIVTNRLRYLSIGNEVDVYLSAHPEKWAAYRRFYTDAVTYAHRVLPNVKVSVTATFDGANGYAKSEVTSLNVASDVWALTYYPLGADFSPRPPSTATTDFAAMTKLAGSRPLVLQEVGYPSAKQLGSSDRQQAEFARAVLAAWSQQGDRIPLLAWFALHDFDQATCDQFGEYYGLPRDSRFKAFLCSLGLRTVDGTAKESWRVFVERN